MKLPNNLPTEISIFLCLLGILAGFIAAILSIDLVKPSNWPDIVTAAITSMAFLLALMTYYKWFDQKLKDDAYTAAKEYIKMLSEIERNVRDIRFHFNLCIPTAGALVRKEEAIKQYIDLLNQKIDNLDQASLRLENAKSDLEFLGVKLANEAAHEETRTNLFKILTSSSGLHNCLVNEYIHKYPDSTLESWNSNQEKSTNQILEKASARRKSKMQSFFIFDFS